MANEGGYKDLLRGAIEAQESSRRKLSFALADRTGNQQTSEYRALGKYLAGDETPSQERAVVLAVLLDEPALAVVPDAKGRRRDRLEALEAHVAELLLKQAELAELVGQMLQRERGGQSQAVPRKKAAGQRKR